MLAHRVISRPRGNSVAFGLKRALGPISRARGLISEAFNEIWIDALLFLSFRS
jgi:hypothetical protein